MQGARRCVQTGSVAVEFSLIAILFFTFLFGIMELARIMYVYSTLAEVHAKRCEGGREYRFSQNYRTGQGPTASYFSQHARGTCRWRANYSLPVGRNCHALRKCTLIRRRRTHACARRLIDIGDVMRYVDDIFIAKGFRHGSHVAGVVMARARFKIY